MASVAIATALVSTSAPAALAAPTSDAGLYGSADPTYDGVFRQSLAVLGLDAAQVDASPAAITWLLRQQCADGSFTAYRADPTTDCPAGFSSTASRDVGPQTDATALASLALASVPSERAQRASIAALNWLERTQLPNGGWTYQGGPTANADSTGLATLALRSERPTSASVSRGTRFLLTLALPCAAGGGLPFEAGGPTNTLASAQGAWGLGATVPIEHQPLLRNPTCTADPRTAVSSALANGIMATGLLPSSFGSGADPSTTATAVIALNGMGVGRAAVARAMRALAPQAAGYAQPGAQVPAALGLLMLAADAAGRNPRALGGVNLVAALRATQRP